MHRYGRAPEPDTRTGCHCPPGDSLWENWHDIRCPLRGTPKRKAEDMAGAVEGVNRLDIGFKKSAYHDTHVALHGLTLEVKAEFKRAISKHGFSRTPASPDMSDGDRLKILVEEVGEVARAMTYDEGSTDKLVAELIQVATMALASAIGVRERLQTEGV